MRPPLRIAVTGASGFVGRYVMGALLASGHQVTAVGRSAARLERWQGRARLVEMDMTAPAATDYDRLGRPEVLVHLAWDGLPNYKQLRHFEDELPTQYRFLKTLIEQGLPSLVVSGTCFEYGLQSGRLAESLPTAPITVYGFAKDALRRQLEFLKATRPFRLTWARLFYMYGDGQAPTSLWPALERLGKGGGGVFPMSSGEQLRDFLPVTEIAGRIAALAEANRDAGPVNICSGRPISVRSLVEGWIAEHGWTITLDRSKYPIPDYEPMAFWGDDTYFQTLTKDGRNGAA